MVWWLNFGNPVTPNHDLLNPFSSLEISYRGNMETLLRVSDTWALWVCPSVCHPLVWDCQCVACLSTCLWMDRYVLLSVCLYLSMCLSGCLPTSCLPVCLSVSIHLAICLHVSIYLLYIHQTFTPTPTHTHTQPLIRLHNTVIAFCTVTSRRKCCKLKCVFVYCLHGNSVRSNAWSAVQA